MMLISFINEAINFLTNYLDKFALKINKSQCVAIFNYNIFFMKFNFSASTKSPIQSPFQNNESVSSNTSPVIKKPQDTDKTRFFY